MNGGASQARNTKMNSGTGGQGKYRGQEGRVRTVFRPTLCESLIRGVTQFVCVTKDAKNKGITSNSLETGGWCGAPGIQKAFVL